MQDQKQEEGSLCGVLNNAASELERAEAMADELAALPSGEKVQTDVIKSQLGDAVTNIVWAEEKLEASGRCDDAAV